MRPAAHLPPPQLLPPTSSLPPLRTLDRAAEDRLFRALDNLYGLYCAPSTPPRHRGGPPTSLEIQSCLCRKKKSSSPFPSPSGAGICAGTCTPAPVDSGYISENEEEAVGNGVEDDDDDDDDEDGPAALRADPFERGFAERWLTGFLARAEEEEEGEGEGEGEEHEPAKPRIFSSADARDRAVELASRVLSSFFAGEGEDGADAEESARIAREFRFRLAVPGAETATAAEEITVCLNDGLAGTRSDDHTDVGLQSWAGAIVFSELLCASPAKFGLVPARTSTPTINDDDDNDDKAGRRGPHIVELGAGTGLVSLVLAKALPRLGVRGAAVVASDYHPAVMENLRANIAMNFPSASTCNAGTDAGTEDAAIERAGAGDGKGTSVTVPVEARQLDWADPEALDGPPLAPGSADLLVATDVVYAPEHAAWLRGCASRLLKRKGKGSKGKEGNGRAEEVAGGVFWLVATVRPTGKFEGICDTVRAVFGGVDEGEQTRRAGGEDGHSLTILEEEWIEKRPGLGRGDESGYRLFRIGWA